MHGGLPLLLQTGRGAHVYGIGEGGLKVGVVHVALKDDITKMESEGKENKDGSITTDWSEGGGEVDTGLLSETLSAESGLVTSDASSTITFAVLMAADDRWG